MAAVQMTSGADREANLRSADRLVRRAAAEGAELVVLPEKWPHLHGDRLMEGAEPLDGPSLGVASRWARDLGIAVLAGSVVEEVDGDDRARNTSVLFAPDGEPVGVYRKMHMFDVDVGGIRYRESDGTAAGDEIVVGEVLGRRIGMSICYDLRFPELYRSLSARGADLIVVPAAFTSTTGPAHWETLLRARAIENQAFVVASGQWGEHGDGTSSHGHSMVIDPWGVILAEAPDGEGLAIADIDFSVMEDVRTRLPALRHRRSDIR
ncbi:MAG: carbon-nitrogen hydrolase family protein [Thermoleophilia bacterium]